MSPISSCWTEMRSITEDKNRLSSLSELEELSSPELLSHGGGSSAAVVPPSPCRSDGCLFVSKCSDACCTF